MAEHERRRSPVYRQLEAYREAWQEDHDAAMICRDCEEVISIGIATYRLLHEGEQAWRDRVFRGTLVFDPEDDREQRERFTLWLEITESILRKVLPTLEQQFGTVEGAEHLRACASESNELLKTWQSPRISVAVGLREMSLTPEAAAELDQLLEQTRQSPLPMPLLQVVKKDASWLKQPS